MKRTKTYNRTNYLIGIPIVFSVVLLGVYLKYYKPEFKKEPFHEVIYVSDRYKLSSQDNWHLIDFKGFTIETPKDYHYYLEQGFHGGKVGGLTNSKDTLEFAFGNYYFDACDGIVVGQIIGTCDTLEIFKNGNKKTIFVRTDNNYCAYVKSDNEGNGFKIWTSLTSDRQLVEKIFKSIKTR